MIETKQSDRTGRDSAVFRDRLVYKLRTAWREPTAIIGVLLTIVFAYLILVPIATLLYDSIEVQFGDQRRTGVPVGGLTSYYLSRALFSPVANDLFWEPLSHTLNISVGVIIISLSVGGVLAWLLGRTDLFGRRWFATALIVPYMLPSWTFALAWRHQLAAGGELVRCCAVLLLALSEALWQRLMRAPRGVLYSDRAGLGAVQAQMESTVRNLSNVAENTAAATGRVIDTDYAAETANLTKAQILQQAATSILAQANAQPQSVLALLQ